MSDGPREVTPYQDFSFEGMGIKNFGPVIEKVHPVEEEALPEPAPKDLSAPVSVPSLGRPSAPVESETPVLPAGSTLEALDEAAVRESGKLSELSEEERPTPLTPSPLPENSWPSSFSPMSPGWTEPPVPVRPPT